jgi:hypothetical protein
MKFEILYCWHRTTVVPTSHKVELEHGKNHTILVDIHYTYVKAPLRMETQKKLH